MATAADFSNFSDFLRARVGGPWVLARRTARIVKRYGEDVVCLSQRRYDAIRAEFEAVRRWSWFDARWGQVNGNDGRWLC